MDERPGLCLARWGFSSPDLIPSVICYYPLRHANSHYQRVLWAPMCSWSLNLSWLPNRGDQCVSGVPDSQNTLVPRHGLQAWLTLSFKIVRSLGFFGLLTRFISQNKSFSSSNSGLPTSRHTANSSYASSVGPGNRPTSRSHIRARSQTSSRIVRPGSSNGTREETKVQSGQNGQNGTMPPPSHFSVKGSNFSLLPCKRARKYNSVEDMATQKPLPAEREASICSQFNSLSIKDSDAQDGGPQAMSPPHTPTPKPRSSAPTQYATGIPASVTVRSWWKKTRSQEETLCGESRVGQVAPKTPSHKEINVFLTSVENNVKAALTPAPRASPSPTKAPFLSKHSNIKGFVATDIDERLGKFENDFQKIREMMDSAAMDKDKYVEELDIAKRRGKLGVLMKIVIIQSTDDS